MPETMKPVTPQDVEALSYTDFVGWINQWNVLPGAYGSLNKWRVFANITADSNLLEVACTTGFSSRELARMTGCRGVGFDISAASVQAAQRNKELYAPSISVEYRHADGYSFAPDERFTHIIFGAALRFFPDPDAMLRRALDLIEDRGYILATEFYTTSSIPDELVKEARTVFDITPTTVPYKDVMKVYRGLDVLYEDKNLIESETDDELHHYTESTISRACETLRIGDDELRQAMYRRLYRIKDMSNRLRPYQNYAVLVLQYDSAIYPNRFVELF